MCIYAPLPRFFIHRFGSKSQAQRVFRCRCCVRLIRPRPYTTPLANIMLRVSRRIDGSLGFILNNIGASSSPRGRRFFCLCLIHRCVFLLQAAMHVLFSAEHTAHVHVSGRCKSPSFSECSFADGSCWVISE